MDFKDICIAVIKGEFDNNLDSFTEIIRSRKGTLREVANATKFFEFQVGDRVKFVFNTRPAKLAGRVGTLVQHKNKKVVVDLDMPCGKWWKGIICPPNILEKVDVKDYPVMTPAFKKIIGPSTKTEKISIGSEDVGGLPKDFFPIDGHMEDGIGME